MKINGKTALVTGGGVRIGRALVEALARHGCRVVIHCHRSGAAARRLAARLRRRGTAAWVVRADLRTAEGCARTLAEARRLAGRVDLLVNNAAVFHPRAWGDLTEADLTREWDLNTLAPLRLMRAFARQTRRGRIVNVLDRRITSNAPGALPYMLSKKALADLTRLAALELAPGITVNAVAPGAVLPSRMVREKAGAIPLGRRPTLAELSRAVVFLLEAEALTGQIIFVDGGQHLL